MSTVLHHIKAYANGMFKLSIGLCLGYDNGKVFPNIYEMTLCGANVCTLDKGGEDVQEGSYVSSGNVIIVCLSWDQHVFVM